MHSASAVALVVLAGCSSGPGRWFDSVLTSKDREHNQVIAAGRRIPENNPHSAYGLPSTLPPIPLPPAAEQMPPPPPPPQQQGFVSEVKENRETALSPVEVMDVQSNPAPATEEAAQGDELGATLDRWFSWMKENVVPSTELPPVRKPIPGNPVYSMDTVPLLVEVPVETSALPPIDLNPQMEVIQPVEEAPAAAELPPEEAVMVVTEDQPAQQAVTEQKPAPMRGALKPEHVLRLPPPPLQPVRDDSSGAVEKGKFRVVMDQVAYQSESDYPPLEAVPQRPEAFSRVKEESAKTLEEMSGDLQQAEEYKQFIHSGPDPLLTGAAPTPPPVVTEPPPPMQAEAPAPVAMDPPAPPPAEPMPALPQPVSPPDRLSLLEDDLEPVAAPPEPEPLPVVQAPLPPPPEPVAQAQPEPVAAPQMLAPSGQNAYIRPRESFLPEPRYAERRLMPQKRVRLSNY